jgi:hypothetical protein
MMMTCGLVIGQVIWPSLTGCYTALDRLRHACDDMCYAGHGDHALTCTRRSSLRMTVTLGQVARYFKRCVPCSAVCRAAATYRPTAIATVPTMSHRELDFRLHEQNDRCLQYLDRVSAANTRLLQQVFQRTA